MGFGSGGGGGAIGTATDVALNNPSNAQVLTYDATLGKWKNQSPTVAATAGGDLSGTLPNPTVAKVNGVAVSGAPSASGQVMTSTSTSSATWQPAVDTSALAPINKPIFTDSFELQNTGGPLDRSLRIRATGSSLDWEFGGQDLFLSAYTAADMSSTQNAVAQFRSDGPVDWAAKQNFNADAKFAADVQFSAKVSGGYISYRQVSGPYTLVADDFISFGVIEVTSPTACDVTLGSDLGMPVGTLLEICQSGYGQVTIVAATGVTIFTAATKQLRAQWSSAVLRCRASNEWVLSGDLV